MQAVTDHVQSEQAPGTGAAARRPSFVMPSRRTTIAACLAWMAVVSVVALRQQPTGDPYRPSGPRDAAWWLQPIERNPMLRLLATSGLSRVRVNPNTGAVFMVGYGGLILRSIDGGVTWNQRPVTWLDASQRQRPAEGAAVRPHETSDVQLASFTDLDQNSAQQKRQDTPYEKAPDVRTPALSNPPAPLVPFSALTDIAFAQQHGWAVGMYGTVLRSTDGGETWQQIDAGGAEPFMSVATLHDGTTACAGSNNGQIRRTTDAGKTWTNAEMPEKTERIISMVHRSGDEVWATESKNTLVSHDACATWGTYPINADGNFGEMQFASGGTVGWALANNIVMKTTDRASSWDQLPQTLKGPLAFLHFPDEQRGWISSESGVVYSTQDGGSSWTEHAAAPGSDPDPTSLLAVGSRVLRASERNGILSSTDGGKTWARRSAPQVRDVFFLPDARRGWAIGSHGVILVTTDGGRSWTPQPSGVETLMHDVEFLDDGRRGWIVGEAGLVLSTDDGGASWRHSEVPNKPGVYLVHVGADGQRGIVYSSLGLWLTTDGGATWQRPAQDVAFTGGVIASVRLDDGWIIRNDSLNVYRVRDAGTALEPLTTVPARAFGRHPRGALWAIGAQGLVTVSDDEGVSWRPRDLGVRDDLGSIAFSPDGQRGWITSPRGLLLTTANGGSTWERGSADSLSRWYRVTALPRGGALALAAGAVVYHTADGGEWTPIAYAAFPAPWYYAAVLLGLGVMALVVSSGPEVIVAEEPSVADVFVSDRPLERGDPDALALNRVASGLARFLANEKTDPPLTIAITGEWGTGKTSLMNLSRAVLKDFGFRTVWFNAWHHQTEEHLLGALVESLRRDALQAWWNPRGFAVRIRLLMFRGMRQWLPAAGAFLVFCAAAGYFFQEPVERLADASAWMKGLLRFDSTGLTKENAVDLLSILGTAGGLVPLLKGMQAFGASGRQISATLSSYDPLREVRLPTGFRHRFADTFHDITRALAPQQLVIFIDDLDRCKPTNVVATLEMVNFLVSSGRCIVIIGMARERVERCIGIGFKDVAELGPDEVGGEDAKVTASRRLDLFARQYLEKLINIEIPVPRASPAQSQELLASAFRRRDGYRARWAASAINLGQWSLAALAVVAMAAAGYGAGMWIHDEASRVDARALAEKQAKPDTPAQPAAAPPSAVSPVRPSVILPSETPVEAVLVPAAGGRPRWAPIALAIFVALLVAVPRLGRVPVHVEHDSKTFTDALDRWFPLVFEKTSTPRAIKRFLNRVRFYAMSQRAQGNTSIPEPALVALSVLQHSDRLGSLDYPHKLPIELTDERLRDLTGARSHLAAFRHMAEGVSM